MPLKNKNLAMALRTAYLEMHRQTNSRLAKFAVTADQFVCLAILNENNGITQQELTKIAKSDPNTIRAMLVLLQKSGLITRKKHPADARAYSVSMTRRGEILFGKMDKELIPVRNKMLGVFRKTELNQLIDSLNSLSSELSKSKKS